MKEEKIIQISDLCNRFMMGDLNESQKRDFFQFLKQLIRDCYDISQDFKITSNFQGLIYLECKFLMIIDYIIWRVFINFKIKKLK